MQHPDFLQLLRHAPDPGGDGRPPRTAEAWLLLGHRLGLEGLPLLLPGLTPSEATLASARQSRDAAGLEQSWLRACLQEALHALHAAGLSARALKGPDLAARIYPQALVRRSTDIDVLVPPGQRDEALAVLARLDWQPAAHNLRHHHHVVLQRPASPPLELHWAALHGFGTRIPAQALLADDASRHAAELVYLAAHAASHHWERPLWLLDLAAFVRTYPDLQPESLDALAARWHLQRVWRQTQQALVARLGDAALPWPVAAPRAGDRLLARGQAAYVAGHKGSRTRFALHVACLAGRCDNPWRAAWLGQFAALQAAGEWARQHGAQVPGSWPPWPPWPPRTR